MNARAEPLTVEQILEDAGELAALPQVVLRVIETTASHAASAADVERLLSADPALAGKILSLANSAYFGLPRRLSSLKEAIVFLGFKTIRTLALTLTTFAVFLGKADAASLAQRAVWRHAVGTAQCARVLVPLLPPPVQETVTADEAFACGLLHDIGKMTLGRSHPVLLSTIMQTAQTRGMRFHDIETHVLPCGHAMLGAGLALRWNLPPSVCESIAFHHTPRAALVNPRLCAAVALANELEHFVSDGTELDEFCGRAADVLPPLRLSSERLLVLADACRLEMDKGLSLLLS